MVKPTAMIHHGIAKGCPAMGAVVRLGRAAPAAPTMAMVRPIVRAVGDAHNDRTRVRLPIIIVLLSPSVVRQGHPPSRALSTTLGGDLRGTGRSSSAPVGAAPAHSAPTHATPADAVPAHSA